MNNNLIAGIDIGSITTKVVIINQEGKIISKQVIFTGADVESAVGKALHLAVKNMNIDRKKIIAIGITGRGRNSIIESNINFPEVIALGTGAFYLNNKIRTILDIGGYGSKVINIGNKGEILKFILSDKCASSTGSFLENMALLFQLPLEEWINKGLLSRHPEEINTTCAIFAESEVITKLAQNIPAENIIAGIHLSIIKRVIPTLQSVGINREIMFSGGVAKNRLAVKIIENHLGIKLIINPDPQIIGAFGCAILTLKNLKGA